MRALPRRTHRSSGSARRNGHSVVPERDSCSALGFAFENRGSNLASRLFLEDQGREVRQRGVCVADRQPARCFHVAWLRSGSDSTRILRIDSERRESDRGDLS